MPDDPPVHLIRPDPADHPPPVPISPHLLTGWFGLMAVAGVGFGWFANEQPFGNGLLAHPLVVLFALASAALLTLRFLHGRPVTEIISIQNVALGCFIAIVCFFVGDWFGVNLMALP
jgi:hypothetical protein